MGVRVGKYLSVDVSTLTIGVTGGLAELTLPTSTVLLIVSITVPTTHTFTGLTGGEDGRVAVISNDSRTWSMNLSLEDGGSSAGNRFADDDGSDAFSQIGPGGSAAVMYDGTSSRWRIIPLL